MCAPRTGLDRRRRRLNVLDLFSGIGGFSLGLERAGMTTVAFCEFDDKCRRVLTKNWPGVPQYTDVKTLTGEQLVKDGIETIDLICGGFPCQGFSVAGKRKGIEDDRYLWPEYFRLVKEVRPTWVFAENVTGIINMALDIVLVDLESEGYACQTFVIPACAVDAPHRRDRVWIVGYSDSSDDRAKRRIQEGSRTESSGSGQDASVPFANPDHIERTEPGSQHERTQESERSGRVRLDARAVVGNAAGEGLQVRRRHGRHSGETKNGTRLEQKSERRGETLADTSDARLQRTEGKGSTKKERRPGRHSTQRSDDVSDTYGGRRSSRVPGQEPGQEGNAREPNDDRHQRNGWTGESNWSVEPGMGRVVDGFPGRVDRLKQLGNSVVPQIIEVIGNAILESE